MGSCIVCGGRSRSLSSSIACHVQVSDSLYVAYGDRKEQSRASLPVYMAVAKLGRQATSTLELG